MALSRPMITFKTAGYYNPISAYEGIHEIKIHFPLDRVQKASGVLPPFNILPLTSELSFKGTSIFKQ